MSVLDQVITGKKKKAMNIMLYGVHGIGKTTFAASFPNPIYVGAEENDDIDAARLPTVKSWNQFIDQLKAIRDDQHNFRTLVVESLDMLQQVAEKDILSTAGGKGMATAFGGFGRAYEKLQTNFLNVRDEYLKPIREKGIHIIILCHADKSKHEDPITASSWDHYKPALHKKVAPVFQDWVSAILFANYKTYKAENEDGKIYAEGEGERVVFSEERPSHIAKNRFKLPYEMPLRERDMYKVLDEYLSEFYKLPSKVDPMKLAYAKDMASVAPIELREKIYTTIEKATTEDELEKIIVRIEQLVKE